MRVYLMTVVHMGQIVVLGEKERTCISKNKNKNKTKQNKGAYDCTTEQ